MSFTRKGNNVLSQFDELNNLISTLEDIASGNPATTTTTANKPPTPPSIRTAQQQPPPPSSHSLASMRTQLGQILEEEESSSNTSNNNTNNNANNNNNNNNNLQHTYSALEQGTAIGSNVSSRYHSRSSSNTSSVLVNSISNSDLSKMLESPEVQQAIETLALARRLSTSGSIFSRLANMASDPNLSNTYGPTPYTMTATSSTPSLPSIATATEANSSTTITKGGPLQRSHTLKIAWTGMTEENCGAGSDFVAVRPARTATPSMEPILVKVGLVDGSHKKVKVTPDFTVQDVIYVIAEKQRLQQTEFFSLSETCMCTPTIAFSPPLPPPVTETVKENTKEKERSKDKEVEIQLKPAPPAQICVDRWLDPKNTLKDEGINSSSNLELKIKYFKQFKKLTDPIAVNLYYLQIQSNIVNEVYPCSELMYMKLGALQFLITFGDFNVEKHRIGFLDETTLSSYLPKSILTNFPTTIPPLSPINYLQDRLFRILSQLGPQQSPLEAKRRYLELAAKIPSFGVAPFDVYDINKDFSSKRVKRTLWVAEEGIMLSKKDLPTLFDYYEYKDLSGWEHTTRGIILYVKNPKMSQITPVLTAASSLVTASALVTHTSSLSNESTTISLETSCGEISRTIVDLINSYYTMLMENPGEPLQLGLERFEPLPPISCLLPVSTPPAKIYFPPLPRHLTQDPLATNLEFFKVAYLSRCKEANIAPLSKLLRQIDFALDYGKTFDTLHLQKCNINHQSLEALVKALAKTKVFICSQPQSSSSSANSTQNSSVDNFKIASIDISDNPIMQEGAEALRLLFETTFSYKCVYMRNIGLTFKMAQTLENVLSRDRTMITLDVSNNPNLTANGVSLIVKALKFNTNFANFAFENLGLDVKSMAMFAQMLERNAAVVGLNIARNKVGEEGMKKLVKGVIKSSTVENLNFSGTGISTKYASILGEWLQTNRSLRMLNLSDNSLNSSVGVSISKALSSTQGGFLVTLDIALSELGDKGIKAIATSLSDCQTLRELNLSGNKISKKAGTRLCQSLPKCNLRVLKLRVCSLETHFIKELAQTLEDGTTLLTLDLGGNQMLLKACIALGSMISASPPLEELVLNECFMGTKEVMPLIDALGEAKKLKNLDLNLNPIGKQVFQSLPKVLLQNQSLVSLGLRGIGVSVSDMSDFFRSLRPQITLQTLDLRENNLEKNTLTPDIVSKFFSLKNIKI